MMEKEDKEHVFLLENDQLTEEICRMDALLADMPKIPDGEQVDGFRLSHNNVFDRTASVFAFTQAELAMHHSKLGL